MGKKILTDEYFMKQALIEAGMAFDAGEVPVGAVIVSDQHIIARAHNLTESLRDATAHAEMLALTAAFDFLGSKYLNDCTLYVTVEPCAMCAGALAWAQIGHLWYAAADPQKGYSLYTPGILHPGTKIHSGLLAVEAGKLISRFFENIRK